MEAFSLLKYWKITTSTGAKGAPPAPPPSADPAVVIQTTSSETETDDDDNNDDDGPFFDLEFTVPDEEEEEEDKNGAETVDFDSDDSAEEDDEFKLTVTSSPSNKDHQSLTLLPSDDLFFKGKLVPIDNDSNSKPPHLGHFHVSLLKSATKFRVFMLRFKKPNKPHEKSEDDTKHNTTNTTTSTNNNNNKFFTVKFKVEEVPIVSLFTKDKQKQNTTATDDTSVSEEKRFSKDVMKNYFQKVKPLYVRVSKRYGDKLRFSGQLPATATPPSTAVEKNQPEVVMKSQKQGNLQAGMRVVCKRLGKSRSASAAAAASATVSVDTAGQVAARRRDDSLLQQQDGIQGAILHCKRSFNGSRDTESSVLSRSVSDPCHGKPS